MYTDVYASSERDFLNLVDAAPCFLGLFDQKVPLVDEGRLLLLTFPFSWFVVLLQTIFLLPEGYKCPII